jgi:hypothetical protein
MAGRNQIWGIAASMITYLLIWNLTYFTSGNVYLAYLLADILSAFAYSFASLPSELRFHFATSEVFHYLFSTSMVYYLLISLIFIMLGLI